jgi:Concanavalin A-like lectin/glucanases superfamily/Carboxypeptidase regulatory-like domain
MSRLFTGVECVDTPSATIYADLGSGTITYWGKATRFVGNNVSWAKNSGAVFFPAAFVHSGDPNPPRINFVAGDSLGTWDFSCESASGLFSIGVWGHIALVWDWGNNNPCKMYFNGVLQALDQSRTTPGIRLSDAAGGYCIGGFAGVGSNGWNGLLSDFRVYNRILTPTEIVSDFSGAVPAPSNLVGRWKMCANEVGAPDSSGNGNNASFSPIVPAPSTDDPPTSPCLIPPPFQGGIISGNVVVSGATIECVSDRFDSSKTKIFYTSSDSQGNYSFSGLLAGNYYLSASAPGFVYRQRVFVMLDGVNGLTNINIAPAALNSSNSRSN